MQIDSGRIMNNIIDKNNVQYSIPVYQRNYEWKEDNCKKLFEDIVQAELQDKKHFCGSIVTARLGEDNKIERFIIIDGQQRITTIYLLLKALYDSSQSDKDKDVIIQALFNIDKYDRYRIDEASKLKLKPVKSDNIQLVSLMEDKSKGLDDSCGLLQNYALFMRLIKDAIEKDTITIKGIYSGIEKLTCALIRLEPDDNPQEIFERINSTGLPLSLADKIRNYVLMTDKDQERLYETYWMNIEKIAKDELSSFFIDYLNLMTPGIIRENDAYEGFKKLFIENKYTNESVLQEIAHYAAYYDIFKRGSTSLNDRINSALDGLRKLHQTTIYVFLYRVFDDYYNKYISDEVLGNVLWFFLSYSVRRLTCERGSNALRSMYKYLYTRLFQNKENKLRYFDTIISYFSQTDSQNRWPSDEDFSVALLNNNLYSKKALCNYLLSSIENKESKEKIILDGLSIEHILPQNRELDATWKSMLGGDWENIQNKYLHTIGNLTLSGYNPELSDLPYLEKKAKLLSVCTKLTILNKAIINNNIWDESVIINRASDLTTILINYFPTVTPTFIVSFADTRYVEYTADNPDDAIYKVPNYYILSGVKVKTNSFNPMLRDIIHRLYIKDPRIIENLAKTNARIMPSSRRILFSYDSTIVKSQCLLPDTSIYMKTGFSAHRVMILIKHLLSLYKIPLNEFKYSARPSKPSEDAEVQNPISDYDEFELELDE